MGVYFKYTFKAHKNAMYPACLLYSYISGLHIIPYYVIEPFLEYSSSRVPVRGTLLITFPRMHVV